MSEKGIVWNQMDFEKMARLEAVTASWKTVAVAYSGGVDSTLLSWLCARVLGKSVHLYLVQSPFLSARELTSAQAVAWKLHLPLKILPLDLLALKTVRENDSNRCYHCKAAIMEAVFHARLHGAVVVDGSHVDDAQEDRPGRKALLEKGVASPFALAEWTKKDIRRFARNAGLSNWNKPSQSCLATRVPFGTSLQVDTLKRIEAAEDILYQVGCVQVRVRWRGLEARIQVGRDDMNILREPKVYGHVSQHMRQLGFARVVLDSTPLSSD
ncbi:MAG: ATP-dependent sacrificial sulfur transferase LarE [Desulfosoma sp.]